jgi:hypothetical protein
VGEFDWERRRAARFRVKGEAFWSAARLEGRCRVVNVSETGVEIADLSAPLAPGRRLHVTLLLEERRLEAIPVEVVRTLGERLALRFCGPEAWLRREIRELTEDLTPLS